MNLLHPTSLALLCALALAAPCLRAEEPPPTEITSISLEMWSNPDSTETHAIFTGNVTVTGNEIKLTCDRLEVLAERIGDKTATVGKLDKFKSLIATGKVNIVQGDREASCGRAEVYPREEKIVLTEKPVVIDHGNGTVATADPLILFRGDRRVHGENPRITMPPLKNLGYDKNQPAPKPENVPTPPASDSAK
jgi:lipopolysaccharide export system protein LptA